MHAQVSRVKRRRGEPSADGAMAEADVLARLGELAVGPADALATYLEEFELDMCHTPLATPTSLSVYAVHLAALLLTEQLDSARFLWRRLPAEAKAHAELCALWEVGKAMWRKDHGATVAAIGGFAWSAPLLAMLMERLRAELLERAFRRCVGAYSLVSAANLAANLGVPEQKIHEMAAAAGWTTDAESGAYVPSAPEPAAAKPALLAQLELLTSYVAHVDKELK